jgi:pimeloyl-ACP methyl ester carboxylesterase
MLHGLGASSADWAPVVPLFDRGQRLLLVDLPGHGASPRLRGRTTIEGMAAAVGALLDGMEERSVHVLGLSLGGCVALALALGEPARVRSLVLVSAFARLRPAGLAAARRLVTRLALIAVAPMPVVAAHVARGLFPRPEQRPLYLAAVASLSRTSRRAYAGGLRALAEFDARARLSAIRCPVLVVTGERDTTVPRDAQRALVAGIAGAQLVVVPDAGHVPPFDQPDAFGRAVLPFIARHCDHGGPRDGPSTTPSGSQVPG